MRSSKNRSRSKGNRNRSVGNNINRVFDSSGPEGKVRGTPQQIIDKYQQLARDAQLSNDRVAHENFLQHSEHYTRMLGEAMREMEARREQQENNQSQQGRDNNNRDGNRDNNRDDNRNNNQRNRNDEQSQNGAAPAAAGTGEQPDVAPVIEADERADAGLVETPESAHAEKPKRPRARRPRKTDADADASAPKPEGEPQEAAE
ncbi:DUF4167 domain-containing protein [Rhodophyticola sp. SM2404]